MAQPKWSGALLQFGAIAASLVAIIALASQLGLVAFLGPALGFDARYALAADVKTIQTDILELRRDAVNREYLELQREAARRSLTQFERERVEALQRVLLQLDRRLQKIGGVTGE